MRTRRQSTGLRSITFSCDLLVRAGAWRSWIDAWLVGTGFDEAFVDEHVLDLRERELAALFRVFRSGANDLVYFDNVPHHVLLRLGADVIGRGVGGQHLIDVFFSEQIGNRFG